MRTITIFNVIIGINSLNVPKYFSKINTINSLDYNNLKLLNSYNSNTYLINFSENQDLMKINKLVNNIKKTDTNLNSKKIIIFDLKGPEFKIGQISELFLPKGSLFTLDLNKLIGNHRRVYFPLCNYNKYFHIDQVIYLNRGQIKLRIVDKSFNSFSSNTFLETIVETPGVLVSESTINVPHFDPQELIFNIENREIINLAKECMIDYITVPMVKNNDQVIKFKQKYLEDSDIKLIPKIETLQSLENLDLILDNSDAIMLNRKNLEIELGKDKFFEIKDSIIQLSRKKNKPVIVDYQTISII